MILGEQTRANDSDKTEALAGGTARLIRNACKRAGVSLSNIHYDNAIACWDKDASKDDLRKAAKACAPRLQRPKTPVLALGQHALYASEGHYEFKKWRGAKVGNTWVSDGVNQLYANPHYRTALAIHIQRALQKPELIGEHHIRDGDAMQGALLRLMHSPMLAVDIETNGSDPIHDDMLCIGVGTEELVVSVPWIVGGEFVCFPGTEKLLRSVLKTAGTLVAHNGAHDFLGLQAAGFELPSSRFDTLLAHAVAAPELAHGLQYVAGLEFPVPAWKGGFVTSADPDAKGADVYAKRDQYELREYNAKDVFYTVKLVPALQRRLRETHRGQEHYDRLQKLSDLCLKMQVKGMPVSMEQRAQLKACVEFDAARYKQAFEAMAGGIDAGKEGGTGAVKAYFFDSLGTPVISETDTGSPSLGKDALKRYTGRETDSAGNLRWGDDVRLAASTLLKFKLYGKIDSTFLGDKIPIRERDGWHWVTPSWRPWGTITRRFSCSEPNLQQAPLTVRKMYQAPPGWVFVEADLSQLEPRITAELSEDPKLIEVYAEGLDLYKQVAIALFEVGYDDISKSQRQIAKMVWLASGYGTGAETLREQLAVRGVFVSLPQANLFLRRLRSGFPTLARWQDDLIRRAEQTGYVEEPYTEWRRYFTDGLVEHPAVKNFPMQAGGASIVNDMMLRLGDELNWADEFLVSQVHDAICILVPEERGAFWVTRLEEIMSKKLTHVNLISEAKCSKDWYACK